MDQPFAQVRKVKVTAYTSSPDETDDTPSVTASGTNTRHGVIAANFLPFGTKVRIPNLFGDTVFTVEDRMARRFQDRLDIWFPTKTEAKRFGLQFAEVEIEI
ncbi:MAG: 3D domain-containing protein [Candidatus Sungbacteria bacterium]|nr:3D domain-containing protein [Candidatus Sungbacteria bacterium]